MKIVVGNKFVDNYYSRKEFYTEVRWGEQVGRTTAYLGKQLSSSDDVGEFDAFEDWPTWYGPAYLTPTPGNEDKVRRFIALGRLNNPDFPFVYKERDAD